MKFMNSFLAAFLVSVCAFIFISSQSPSTCVSAQTDTIPRNVVSGITSGSRFALGGGGGGGATTDRASFFSIFQSLFAYIFNRRCRDCVRTEAELFTQLEIIRLTGGVGRVELCKSTSTTPLVMSDDITISDINYSDVTISCCGEVDNPVSVDIVPACRITGDETGTQGKFVIENNNPLKRLNFKVSHIDFFGPSTVDNPQESQFDMSLTNSEVLFHNCRFEGFGMGIYAITNLISEVQRVDFVVERSEFKNMALGGISLGPNSGDLPEGIGVSIKRSVFEGITSPGTAPLSVKAGNLAVEYSSFNKNGDATAKSGGILVTPLSVLSVIWSDFDENVGAEGGAIHVDKSLMLIKEGLTPGAPLPGVSVQNCRFTNNQSKDKGGAVVAELPGADTLISFVASEFDGNSGANDGGAIHAHSEFPIQMVSCAFMNNIMSKSSGAGGACWLDSAQGIVIDDCTFEDNSSEGSAGACYATGPVDTTVSKSTFTNNRSTLKGGAAEIYLSDEVVFDDCEFTENIVEAGPGGGLYVADVDLISIFESEFDGNRANIGKGGGIFFSTVSNVTISSSDFENNFAQTDGGAIAAQASGLDAGAIATGFGNIFDDNVSLDGEDDIVSSA